MGGKRDEYVRSLEARIEALEAENRMLRQRDIMHRVIDMEKQSLSASAGFQMSAQTATGAVEERQPSRPKPAPANSSASSANSAPKIEPFRFERAAELVVFEAFTMTQVRTTVHPTTAPRGRAAVFRRVCKQTNELTMTQVMDEMQPVHANDALGAREHVHAWNDIGPALGKRSMWGMLRRVVAMRPPRGCRSRMPRHE